VLELGLGECLYFNPSIECEEEFMERREAERKLMDLLRTAKKDAPIPFSQRDGERALAGVLSTEDIWEALRLSHIPMRFACAFWNAMISKGFLAAEEGKLYLTDSGKALTEALGIKPARDLSCDSCEGRGIGLQGLFQDISNRFHSICENRPEAIQDYDQGYVTEETTLARIAFAYQRGDLEGKDIVVLGDDDLMSIAAALTGAPRRVLALDIDERLVKFINDVARSEGLKNLEAVRYDLREPSDEGWIGAFDTFLCDPTESFVGLKLFVERGISYLKGIGSAGYFGLTHAESSLHKWHKIQEFILKRGAVITDFRDDFNRYVNWGYMETMRSWTWLPTRAIPKRVWYCSAFCRIELLRNPKRRNDPVTGDIFDDEEAATT
jgi:predicted methyltransferase